MQKRLSRFKRAKTPYTGRITERDRAILAIVGNHRFIRSSQIAALAGGSAQQVLRRLQYLYHQGLLDRPRQQLDYFYKGGSRQIIYGLTPKSAALLGLRPTRSSPVGRTFLDHAVLVSDILAAIELACQSAGLRFVSERDLSRTPEGHFQQQSFRWHVTLNGGLRLSCIPDGVFGIQLSDDKRIVFFVECDRGTMPVARRNLVQTSFYRKLLAYEASWVRSVHRERFGFHRFRVLTVTTGPERLSSLLDACSRLKRGHGLFLFTDIAQFQNSDPLSLRWRTCGKNRMGSMLD